MSQAGQSRADRGQVRRGAQRSPPRTALQDPPRSRPVQMTALAPAITSAFQPAGGKKDKEKAQLLLKGTCTTQTYQNLNIPR